jgi:deoxyribodipyrimidine photo-lyase
MKTVLVWFRRDLRLADNTALSEAARRAKCLVPVFVLEDALRSGPDVGAARLAFLLRSAKVLQENLKALGYPLVIRSGKSVEVIPALARELGAEAVFCNKRSEPYARARDDRIFNELNGLGIGFEVFKDAVAWEDQEILTQAGRPFTVFTPYARAWKARRVPVPRPCPGPARVRPIAVRSEELPRDPAALGHPNPQPLPPAGEEAAQSVWHRFLAGPLLTYAQRRDYPAVDGTSGLSVHLRAGTIGIRTVLAQLAAARSSAAPEGQRSCDVFLNELIWREFYHQVLVNHPHVVKGAFRPEYDALGWSQNQNHFQAWCEGRTGFPIVDAAMRCLAATGNLHNRLRMIVAMFLTKDLLIHWQWGERFFMKHLFDGDLAANNGGWQWSAGTGTDAAPYFRIFNPVAQGERFDPEGVFVRRWVPELEKAPARWIHQPWKAPERMPTSGYPERVVHHEEQREKCLAMFKAIRSIPRPPQRPDRPGV